MLLSYDDVSLEFTLRYFAAAAASRGFKVSKKVVPEDRAGLIISKRRCLKHVRGRTCAAAGQMAENLSAGARVRLHSLQAAAQHNGVDGHLLKWNASTGRWHVKLSTGPDLSVRPANVMMIGRAPTAREKRVYVKMSVAFNAGKYAEVVKMAEEGQAVAGEVRTAWPEKAAGIYCMLGSSFVDHRERVKGVGLLEQARALAVEAGDRGVLGEVCNSLGNFHQKEGEPEKAIEEFEQARAIAVELGDREGEET